MGWQIGYDRSWDRDIGYGVPAVCDHPDCDREIDRGLSYVCGCQEPYGGEHGCGLFFCEDHQFYKVKAGGFVCQRCRNGKNSFPPKPDVDEWIKWKLTDDSWAEWRGKNPEFAQAHLISGEAVSGSAARNDGQA
jgi:hypothetical protein